MPTNEQHIEANKTYFFHISLDLSLKLYTCIYYVIHLFGFKI